MRLVLLVIFAQALRDDACSLDSFFVERRDGAVVEVDFSYSDDVLVIMLGDGIDAIVNPKMPVWSRLPHALSDARLVLRRVRS